MSFATPLKQSTGDLSVGAQVSAAKSSSDLPSTTAKGFADSSSGKKKKSTTPRTKQGQVGDALPTAGAVAHVVAQADSSAPKKKRVTKQQLESAPVALQAAAAQLTYQPCPACKLATPFCCLSGKQHEIQLCSECGLKSRFCPNTGKEHPYAHLLNVPIQAVAAAVPVASEKPAKKKARTESRGLPAVSTQQVPAQTFHTPLKIGVAAAQTTTVASLIASSAPAAPCVEKKPKKMRLEKAPMAHPVEGDADEISLADRVATIVNTPIADKSHAEEQDDERTKLVSKEKKPRVATKKRGETKLEDLIELKELGEGSRDAKKPARKATKKAVKAEANNSTTSISVAGEAPVTPCVVLSSSCARCGQKVKLAEAERGGHEMQQEDGQVGQPQPQGGQCITCGSCGKQFHRACYLAETGLIGKKSSIPAAQLQLMPCVLCRSTILTNESFNAAIASCGPVASKFVMELLTEGCTVVPLTSTPGETAEEDLEESGKSDDAEDKLDAKLMALRSQVLAYYHALQCSYELEIETRGSVPALATGYANFRERCPGRFEIIAPLIREAVQKDLLLWDSVEPETAAPATSELDAAAAGLLPPPPQPAGCRFSDKSLVGRVLRAALGDDMKFLSSGCFLSMPNAAGQNTHTDGPVLSKQFNLFPYAINVFIPLVDVGPANGTEFYPGTQMAEPFAPLGTIDDAAAEDTPLTLPLSSRTQESPTTAAGSRRITPIASPGHALLFDYRVLHRGLANRTGEARPCLYATFSRPWYTDIYNFGSERYRRELPVAQHFLEAREARASRRDSQKIVAE